MNVKARCPSSWIPGVASDYQTMPLSFGHLLDTYGLSISLAKLQLTLYLLRFIHSGGVGEWLKPTVLKTVRPERVSWVRIPPPPPASLGIPL